MIIIFIKIAILLLFKYDLMKLTINFKKKKKKKNSIKNIFINKNIFQNLCFKYKRNMIPKKYP